MNKIILILSLILSYGIYSDEPLNRGTTNGAFTTLMLASPDIDKYVDTLKSNTSAFAATGASDAGVCITRSGNEYAGQMMVWSAFPTVEAALVGSLNYDPQNNFLPTTGIINHLLFPGDIRVDCGIRPGDQVSPFYDPLIAKIIVHAPSREKAIKAMSQALKETHISGIKTNIPCHQHILQHDDFVKGKLHTHLLRSVQQVAEPSNEQPA